MLSTIIVVALFLGLVVLSVVLWAALLRLGLWWANVADVTPRRVAAATGIVFVIQLGVYVILRLPSPTSDAHAVFLGLLELTAAVFVPCLVIMYVFKMSLFRSLQAWLPTPLAPTLLGNHWRGVCPECDRPGFCSPVDARFALLEPPLMICENFHVSQSSNVDERVFSADRFLVAKFLAPHRWDTVAFQYPEDPTTLYVMRLVGLPGETIQIEDGAVWANGKELTPPDSLRGIEYLSELPGTYTDLWGSKDNPALLGDDEYFVLGDFSAQSKDSRLWEQGAPGHSPFAVPASHIDGIVTHIYWPPQRWRVLR